MLTYEPTPRGTLAGICGAAPSPGLVALVDRLLADPFLAPLSPWAGYGLNCRYVNGAKGPIVGRPSAHSLGDGRGGAYDLRAIAASPAEKAVGDRVAAWLVENADALGVQAIIWNRAQWGFGKWSWRPIGSSMHPHHDHIHFELNKKGASMTTLPANLTPLSATPTPAATVPDWFDELIAWCPVEGRGRDGRGMVPMWTSDPQGVVVAHHGATHYGDLGSLHILPDEPVVAIVSAPDGAGYWLVAEDAGVFSFGSAKSPRDHAWMMGAIAAAGGLREPVVDAMHNDKCLVLFAADGGQFPLPV